MPIVTFYSQNTMPKVKNEIRAVATTIVQIEIQRHRDISSFSRVKVSVPEFQFHCVTMSQLLPIPPTNFSLNLSTKKRKKQFEDAEIKSQ